MDINSNTRPRHAPRINDASSTAAQIQSSAESTSKAEDGSAQARLFQRGRGFFGFFA